MLQALRMMLGLDLVSVAHRNLTLNNVPVAQGEPLFQNGWKCAVGNVLLLLKIKAH